MDIWLSQVLVLMKVEGSRLQFAVWMWGATGAISCLPTLGLSLGYA
jgi:hypothetical protein